MTYYRPGLRFVAQLLEERQSKRREAKMKPGWYLGVTRTGRKVFAASGTVSAREIRGRSGTVWLPTREEAERFRVEYPFLVEGKWLTREATAKKTRCESPATIGGVPLETALLEAYDSPFITRITLDEEAGYLTTTAVLVDGSRVKLEGLEETT